ncbi:MAG TPA: hypothetical protein VL354_19170, partial [Spirochaetia bacterium]|nr:hypothetical protein [Spirochaetia bacterium]
KVTSHGPGFVGKEQIVAKWNDSEGNIWYKIQGAGVNGDKAFKWQSLQKLSKSATVREFIVVMVDNYSPDYYPTKLDPNDSNYRVYYRAKE